VSLWLVLSPTGFYFSNWFILLPPPHLFISFPLANSLSALVSQMLSFIVLSDKLYRYFGALAAWLEYTVRTSMVCILATEVYGLIELLHSHLKAMY
jgi:hypothetical protein